MKVKMIKKLPRLMIIPGELKLKEYRALQAGKSVEIDGASAHHLIAHGYVEAIKELQKESAPSGPASAGQRRTENGGDK